HDLVERAVGKVRCLVDRRIVHLRPQRLEALALGDAPAGKARALRVCAADINVNPADLKRVRAVERQDAAVRRPELRIQRTGHAGGGDEQHDRDGETAGEHSWRLLATTAWKSKRLVSSGRDDERKAADLC